jgi:hypothetical protein
VCEAIGRLYATRLSVPDADVMNNGVKSAARVGLFSDLAHSVDRGDVTDQDIGIRKRSPGVGCSGGAAGVQGHRVTVVGQQPACHETKAVG